jgi:hypothetical protein
MINIVKNVKEKEWKSFLNKCDEATIYHTPEWKQFMEKTFGYKSEYLFAKDESGNIIGFLPLFYIKSKLTGNRLCSVPFSHTCDYLGEKEVEDQLIKEGIYLSSRLSADFFEIRTAVDNDLFEKDNSFSTYILELSDVDSTWNLIHKSMRRFITKSQKTVEVIKYNNHEGSDIFYELNCKNKRGKGVPSHPKKFIGNLVEYFPENISIYIAYLEKVPIGGIITLFYENKWVLYGYGASDPEYLTYHPLQACLWESIKDSCIKQFKYYDFGRASYDNEGLINFKKRWGASERKLYYSFYPKNPKSITDNRNNFIYIISTKIIKKMPMYMYKKFGSVLFGHFG